MTTSFVVSNHATQMISASVWGGEIFPFDNVEVVFRIVAASVHLHLSSKFHSYRPCDGGRG
ncbi:unnamed protein product, partial [Amoebophrya sp. A120]|eukprot:GSA120T00020618001.1